MSKIWIALLAAAIVLTPTVSARAFDPGPPASAAPAPTARLAHGGDPPEPADPVYAWLKAQQHSMSGLLPDQENDLSKLYTQALAAMTFTAWGDTQLAEKVLDSFQGRANEFYAGRCGAFDPTCVLTACGSSAPCGFFDYRYTATGSPIPGSDRWIGDNAWLALAIHHYQARTGNTKYAAMAQAIIVMLKSLQQPAGYIATGWQKGDQVFNLDGHAEGNLDAYRALAIYGQTTAAVDVKDWLDYANPELEHNQSLNWYNGPLDLHSWRVLAMSGLPTLGKEYGYSVLKAQRTDSDTVRYRTTLHLRVPPVDGFVDRPLGFFPPVCDMSNNIHVEGTAAMALALYLAGYRSQGDYYVRELSKLSIERPGVLTTRALPYLPLPVPAACPEYQWVDPNKGHVAATAWYLFAREIFNPFEGTVIQDLRLAQPVASLEAEYPDADSGLPGYRRDARPTSVLSEGRAAHMGGDNDPGNGSGWAEYKVQMLMPVGRAAIRLRYADDVGGDMVRVIWDGQVLGSFTTESTGSWDQYVDTVSIPLGTALPGLHTVRIEVADNGTYGTTIDFARIDGDLLSARTWMPFVSK